MSDQEKPPWSESAQIVADALKHSDEKDIAQIIMSSLERYSIAKHRSAETRIVPILAKLRTAIGERIRSV